jgi:hypothetical protein
LWKSVGTVLMSTGWRFFIFGYFSLILLMIRSTSNEHCCSQSQFMLSIHFTNNISIDIHWLLFRKRLNDFKKIARLSFNRFFIQNNQLIPMSLFFIPHKIDLHCYNLHTFQSIFSIQFDFEMGAISRRREWGGKEESNQYWMSKIFHFSIFSHSTRISLLQKNV